MAFVNPAFVVLTPGGADLAQGLRSVLPSAVIYGSPALADRVDQVFARATDCIAALFAAGTPVIGVCAAGILVRAVAPLLADKRVEPPVLALAEDGSAVVPLLGGHHGANALARELAEALGVVPSITTAGDLRWGLALDEPPAGWRLADATPVKSVTQSLLAGEKLRIEGEAPWLDALPMAADGAVTIAVTPRTGIAASLVYHPAVLALGVGCERGTDPAELIDLAGRALAEAGLAAASVACVVSLDLKADEVAVHALADKLGVPARFFDAGRLALETDRLANPSEAVHRETGCWGVSEGAALAAAGPAATLIVPKHKSARATVAIAQAPTVFEGAGVGRARGKLTVIGIGPGAAAWRTPEATAALTEARHVVGYKLYLDLLGDLIDGKQTHETGLGHEEARARRALELAAAGETVALVSSGDAGIYGLATLAFELVEQADDPAWRRIALSVAPGISALQAAAARVGAPLGHDFCAISLSDLLTPRPAILQRLEAAAAADFVVALYNPRSERRRDLLAAAREIFLARRPPDTPVLLARNLGRPSETITTIDLADLAPDRVDMLTLVMIGSSATRRIPGTGWVYTPRGYAKKRGMP